MKIFKKFTKLVMTIVMIMTLTVSTFAAGFVPAEMTKITLTRNTATTVPYALSDTGTTVTRSWNGYRLLNLTTSLNCDDEQADHTHGTNCYNYAYTVNSKYEEVLYDAANDLIASNADEIEDETALLAFLGTMDDETIREFADNVYREIILGSLNPDKQAFGSADVNTTEVPQGWWLFADVTYTDPGPSEGTVTSVVLIDTKGQLDIEVNPKVDIPTVVKKVSDDDVTYGDFVDVNISDTVWFKLTGTVSEYIDSYATYSYTFHDELSDGLTFDADSVEVKIGGSTIASSYYTVVTDVTDDCTFEVKFTDLKAITVGDAAIVDEDSEVVVKYQATLNADAEIGGSGNPNTVVLEYANNPYTNATGLTEEDTVKVYTFELDVVKVDGDHDEKKLSGAQFKLYRMKDGAKEYVVLNSDKTVNSWTATEDGATLLTTDANGKISVIGLEQGTYYLSEVKAPDGYNLIKEAIELEIKAEYDLTGVTSLTINVDDDTKNGTTSTGIVSTTVANYAGTLLPETGGIGTTIFYIVGGTMVLAAIVLLVTKKRMRGNA